jgi:hypothetical protein
VQLLLSEFAGLAQGDAAGVPKYLAECPVRDTVAGGQATPTQYVDVGPTLDSGRDHLAYQSTLADPRGRDDRDQARTAARRRLLDQAQHHAGLVLPPHHRRLGLRLRPAGRPVRRQQWARTKPTRPRRRAEAELAVRRPARPVGDQHGTWFGRLAQLGGHIEHLAAEAGQ